MLLLELEVAVLKLELMQRLRLVVVVTVLQVSEVILKRQPVQLDQLMN